jgi:hypothetical protein
VRQVDDAILSCYLAGANSRRLRKALEPLLGGEHLSKSAVSRVVARLKEHFAAWTSRDLSDELYSIIYARGGGGLRRLLLVLPAAGRWVADTTGIHLGIRRATLMRRARPLMC